MEEAPQDVLVIYSASSKQTKEVTLDFNFFRDIEDIRIRYGRDEYKLVSTRPAEEVRLEKQIVTFGTKEFPRIAKKFPAYGTSSANMKFTDEMRNAIRSRLDRPMYKNICKAVTKDPQIFIRICQAFAQFISATRTIDAMVAEAKARRQDDVYLIDYMKRYRKIMDLLSNYDDPPQRKTISDMFAEINKDIDIDDRRPIGSNKIYEFLSPFTAVLQKYKDVISKVPMEDKFYTKAEGRDEMWDAVYKGAVEAYNQLTTHLKEYDNLSAYFNSMEVEDKLHYHTARILNLHKSLLRQHQEAYQTSQHDPASIGETQHKFVSNLRNYIDDVSDWGCRFVCDRRELSSFFNKMLELQYDTVFYHLERRSKDEQWIFNLVNSISQHIPYLEKALKGELKDPNASSGK